MLSIGASARCTYEQLWAFRCRSKGRDSNCDGGYQHNVPKYTGSKKYVTADCG